MKGARSLSIQRRMAAGGSDREWGIVQAIVDIHSVLDPGVWIGFGSGIRRASRAGPAFRPGRL
jgi:hypothetical protein